MITRGGTGKGTEAPGTTTGDMERHVGSERALGIADTGGIQPWRLQDWRAHGHEDCRIRGQKALEIAGRTDIESLRQEAIWHRVSEVHTGQSVEG